MRAYIETREKRLRIEGLKKERKRHQQECECGATTKEFGDGVAIYKLSTRSIALTIV
jgi:hypothetical protein